MPMNSNDFAIDNKVNRFETPMPLLEEMVPTMEEKSLDDKFIQLIGDTKNKIDEAKEKVNRHIKEDHREDDIYKFLLQTKRGRFFCKWLLGYRTEKIANKIKLEKLEKAKKKLNKIRGL